MLIYLSFCRLCAARRLYGAALLPLLAAGSGGCTTPTPALDAEEQRQMLALLMPSRVEIVEPFTRVETPDPQREKPAQHAIELLIQAVNILDSPGVMVGRVRVELYEFVPASGDRKGRRLEHWNIELSSREDQLRYWNRLTQMYEFRLGIDATKIPRADKYVLLLTYDSPLGERLTDEYVIASRAPGRPLGGGTARRDNIPSIGARRGRR